MSGGWKQEDKQTQGHHTGEDNGNELGGEIKLNMKHRRQIITKLKWDMNKNKKCLHMNKFNMGGGQSGIQRVRSWRD